MRVIELKVEVGAVVALTLHPRLTVIDAGAPNDILINAIRSLVAGEPVKVHAVVAEGDRNHLCDADELRALGWVGSAMMLDVDGLPPLADQRGHSHLTHEEVHSGPIADLAAKVAAAGVAAESADLAAARAAEALNTADAQNERVVASLRNDEYAIGELETQSLEMEHRLSELTKRRSTIAAHLDTVRKLRDEPPRVADQLVDVIDSFDALPAESVDEMRTAMREWNRPVLSTYDLLMGDRKTTSSLEEQFGLTPSEPAEGQLAVARAERLEDRAALPAVVLDHLDEAQLTLSAQAERMKDISITINASIMELTTAITDRRRRFTSARAAMLARTGERDTLRHQRERAIEGATAAREQLADLEVAGRIVQHIAGMPVHAEAGRPPLVVEHRSNDATRRDRLLRALPVISGETQVLVVTSDTKVLDWARGLSGMEGALRSASAL